MSRLRYVAAILFAFLIVACASERRVEVAIIETRFLYHVKFMLTGAHIDAVVEGLDPCKVSVPKDQRDAAIKVIKEDSDRYHYKVTFR